MFCPTCGKEAEAIIDFQGAKVCPHCGCVIEYADTTTKKSNNGGRFAMRFIAVVMFALAIVDNLYYVFFANEIEFIRAYFHYEMYYYAILRILSIIIPIGASIIVFICIKKAKPVALVIPLGLLLLLELERIIRLGQVYISYYTEGKWNTDAVFLGRFFAAEIALILSYVLVVLYIKTKNNKLAIGAAIFAVIYVVAELIDGLEYIISYTNELAGPLIIIASLLLVSSAAKNSATENEITDIEQVG